MKFLVYAPRVNDDQLEVIRSSWLHRLNQPVTFDRHSDSIESMATALEKGDISHVLIDLVDESFPDKLAAADATNALAHSFPRVQVARCGGPLHKMESNIRVYENLEGFLSAMMDNPLTMFR